jgi:hypothetical protein
MPKTAADPALDPTSPAIVLTYRGGVRPRNVPARDLTAGDLARVAYHRSARQLRAERRNRFESDEERPAPSRPGPADAEILEAIATELSSSGVFARIAASQEV